MRRGLFFLVFLFLTNLIFAQADPVKWAFTADKVNGDEYELALTATLEDGWYIYSQYLESDEGPVKTSFIFEPQGIKDFVGTPTEAGSKKEGFDEMFGMNVTKFSKKVRFAQKVKIEPGTSSINGVITYMTCNDVSCLPPKDFDFSINFD